MRENYGEIVKRILKSKYLKSHRETDSCVSSASPVSHEPESMDHYIHQPVYISICDEHHISASERKRASHSITSTESDPRISHHRHGHPSQMRYQSDSGKPIGCESMPSSHVYNTHFSAAQILLQDLPKEIQKRPDSPGVRVHRHIVSPSELESVRWEHNLDRQLEHRSVTSLHHKKELSGFLYGPTSLRLSTATVCEVSPSELFVPTSAAADRPDRQRNEIKISGRGSKRIAHMSDKEIKTQRQVIEHKLTPVNPTTQRLSPKNPRRGTTTCGTRDVRSELMKKMSKK